MKRNRGIFGSLGCLILLTVSTLGVSQSSLSLDEAYALAKSNYPMLKTVDIYKAIGVKDNDLIDQSRKPTITLKGDATLQSEALSLGGENSPINVNVPIYRANAYGEISYNVYDGGVSDIRKQINEINTIIQTQQVEVDLYPLKVQINSIFSGVDLGLKLEELFTLTEQDLVARKEVVRSAVEFGTLLESELSKLEVRILQLKNERLQIESDVQSAYSLLSIIIGKEVDRETKLEMPEMLTSDIQSNIYRPELKLFSDKKLAIEAQKDLIEVMDKPNVILFAQAGLGYPNYLNFTDISLSPYAIGGVKASYKLFDKKDKSLKKQKIDLQSELVDVQEETFKHNIKIQSARYQDDFRLLANQVDQYARIAELQSEILSQLKVQLDNGIITSMEYLLQSNEELRARQNVKITQSKLDQKRLEYLTIYGEKQN